ncbi:MAG TPA: hypothetical protein VGG19_01890 [Tepidisphaeraceae bacterium]|jgi:hypothetical protein
MANSNATEDQTTGLAGLRSWRAVYLLVTGIFILWVGLLVALMRIFA